MGNNVYANKREVAAEKGGGNAQNVPTDVCHTPPPPPPLAAAKIGIPIPYPNFSKAGATKNGTKTVKIKNGMVQIKNKSFHKTLAGNNPATTQFKQGIISGKITGKTYPTSWSFDVLFEKKNVVRFKDSSRHNAKS